MSIEPSSLAFPPPPAVVVSDLDLHLVWNSFTEYHSKISGAEGNKAQRRVLRQVAGILTVCVQVLLKVASDRRSNATEVERSQWDMVTVTAFSRAKWLDNEPNVRELLSHFQQPKAFRLVAQTCKSEIERLHQQFVVRSYIALEERVRLRTVLHSWQLLQAAVRSIGDNSIVIKVDDCNEAIAWLQNRIDVLNTQTSGF